MNGRQKFRLAVLISGNGSNLQAVIDSCAAGSLPAQVVAVISNRADAYGIERAKKARIPTLIMERGKGQERVEYDRALAAAVASFSPDWVVLAGWMRLLTNAFLGAFPGRVINLHPALPGTFPGTHAIEHAYEAFQNGEIDHTGVMVHYVPDEEVDSGPVICLQEVPIYPTDALETLESRVHQVEHRLLVDALNQLMVSLGIKQGKL
jgi:formyltetrahydrofolate-dependent phosphoribosylglycinamide formyltransferase